MTYVQLADGTVVSVADLVRMLAAARRVTRVDGVEYDHVCWCWGGPHERRMGCM
jgi:hypothetical protein